MCTFMRKYSWLREGQLEKWRGAGGGGGGEFLGCTNFFPIRWSWIWRKQISTKIGMFFWAFTSYRDDFPFQVYLSCTYSFPPLSPPGSQLLIFLMILNKPFAFWDVCRSHVFLLLQCIAELLYKNHWLGWEAELLFCQVWSSNWSLVDPRTCIVRIFRAQELENTHLKLNLSVKLT